MVNINSAESRLIARPVRPPATDSASLAVSFAVQYPAGLLQSIEASDLYLRTGRRN
jgi:hypothetical protein